MPQYGLGKLWSRLGVRIRAALAAVLVLAIALALAAVVLLYLLERSLESAADDTAGSRVSQLAANLSTSTLNEIDPVMLATDGRTTVIQIVDATGRVVLASPRAPRMPLVDPQIPPGVPLKLGRQQNTATGGDYRVVVEKINGVDGAYTVIVGVAQDPIDATLATVRTLLAAGFPIVALIGGGATFALVGGSLRPVERMRNQVSAISTSDLSERVAVPATRDEISRLAQTMNLMLIRIEAGHAAQRRFIGDASHELRSPLATVTAALELAVERPGVLGPANVEHTLLPEAHRMQHLVEDLLLLARADERGIPLRVSDVDLDDLLDTECRRLQSAGTVRVMCTADPIRIRGDAIQLSKVVRNLADNAARHAVSTVRLEAIAQERSTVALVISDDGPGIPESERARIFERFVRLETDRARDGGGTGLGLAIVQEIVMAHGGSVAVEESSEGGARFVVRLPMAGPS